MNNKKLSEALNMSFDEYGDLFTAVPGKIEVMRIPDIYPNIAFIQDDSGRDIAAFDLPFGVFAEEDFYGNDKELLEAWVDEVVIDYKKLALLLEPIEENRVFSPIRYIVEILKVDNIAYIYDWHSNLVGTLNLTTLDFIPTLGTFFHYTYHKLKEWVDSKEVSR